MSNVCQTLILITKNVVLLFAFLISSNAKSSLSIKPAKCNFLFTSSHDKNNEHKAILDLSIELVSIQEKIVDLNYKKRNNLNLLQKITENENDNDKINQLDMEFNQLSSQFKLTQESYNDKLEELASKLTLEKFGDLNSNQDFLNTKDKIKKNIIKLDLLKEILSQLPSDQFNIRFPGKIYDQIDLIIKETQTDSDVNEKIQNSRDEILNIVLTKMLKNDVSLEQQEFENFLNETSQTFHDDGFKSYLLNPKTSLILTSYMIQEGYIELLKSKLSSTIDFISNSNSNSYIIESLIINFQILLQKNLIQSLESNKLDSEKMINLFQDFYSKSLELENSNKELSNSILFIEDFALNRFGGNILIGALNRYSSSASKSQGYQTTSNYTLKIIKYLLNHKKNWASDYLFIQGKVQNSIFKYLLNFFTQVISDHKNNNISERDFKIYLAFYKSSKIADFKDYEINDHKRKEIEEQLDKVLTYFYRL